MKIEEWTELFAALVTVAILGFATIGWMMFLSGMPDYANTVEKLCDSKFGNGNYNIIHENGMVRCMAKNDTTFNLFGEDGDLK